MNPAYRPLNCHLYDYLELACLRGYHLRIELCDGSMLTAQALSIEARRDQGEFLKVASATGEQQLRLDYLKAITALDVGAAFERIEFVAEA